MILLGAIFLIAMLAKFYWKSDSLYMVLKDFSSIIVAIPAAYLVYCFQRRQAFLVSLRDLWKEMVDAKGELIQYTNDSCPDQAAFGKAHDKLSKATDLVRGVYRNVGETERNIGLYPFEPLHDMRKCLDRLGFKSVTPDQQTQARLEFVSSWNALRREFLREL